MEFGLLIPCNLFQNHLIIFKYSSCNHYKYVFNHGIAILISIVIVFSHFIFNLCSDVVLKREGLKYPVSNRYQEQYSIVSAVMTSFL